MVAIATLEEFASAIQQDVDTATANLLLLDLAQGLVTEIIGDQNPWPVTAKAIALAAAARAYLNPTGATSTQRTAGPFTQTDSYGSAGEFGVYLTDAELARLRRWLNRGGVLGTIRTTSGYPPITTDTQYF